MGTESLKQRMLYQVLDIVKNSRLASRCVTLLKVNDRILDAHVGNRINLTFQQDGAYVTLSVIAVTCDSLGWIDLRVARVNVPPDLDTDAFSRAMLFITEIMELIIDVNHCDVGCISHEGRPMSMIQFIR